MKKKLVCSLNNVMEHTGSYNFFHSMLFYFSTNFYLSILIKTSALFSLFYTFALDRRGIKFVLKSSIHKSSFKWIAPCKNLSRILFTSYSVSTVWKKKKKKKKKKVCEP